MARKAAAQVDPKAEEPKVDEPLPTEDVEISLDEAAEPAESVVETTAPAAPEPAEPPAPPAKDAEEVAALRQRLQEMERAEQLSRERDAERDRLLAEAQRTQRQSQWQAWNDRKTAVDNLIGSAQSQREAAKQEYRAAAAENDVERMTEAQDRLAEAAATIQTYTREKTQMEEREEQWKRQQQQPQRQQQPPRQQQPQQPPTTEQIIAGAAIPDSAKNWLRAHPEFISDPTKNAQLIKMHNVAEYQAKGEFTPAYFERMEVLLGLKQESQHPTNGGGPDAPRPAPVQRQSAHVSAPPTREAPSMTTGRAPQPTQVVLNKEQQEIAYATRPRQDMTRQQANKIYAENLLKMRKMKKDGEIE